MYKNIICISVDEMTGKVSRYIANMIVHCVKKIIIAASMPHSFACKELDKINQVTDWTICEFCNKNIVGEV